jgi:hypothetical protein
MDQNRGRNVGASAAGLVQAEHLEASRDREEEDCGREEHANVVMCKANGLEAGCGGHLAVGLTGNQCSAEVRWRTQAVFRPLGLAHACVR